MAKPLPEGNVQTPEFRIAFPYLFKPRPAQKPDDKPKYELVMLFPKNTDLSALKKACDQVLVKKFSEDKTKWPKNFRKPFRDGDDYQHLAGYPGHIFVAAKSSNPVGIVDEKCQVILSEYSIAASGSGTSSQNDQTTKEETIYPGVYARAIVCPYWYDYQGNKGIGFFLNGIQRIRHGERLVSRSRPEEMFQETDADASPATASGDDW